jgi:hypothetical protein
MLEVDRGRWSRQNLLEAGRTVAVSECVASRWSIRDGGMYQRWQKSSEVHGGGHSIGGSQNTSAHVKTARDSLEVAGADGGIGGRAVHQKQMEQTAVLEVDRADGSVKGR